MNNQKKLRKYTTQFIDKLTPYIKKGLKISANIFPAESSGAIIEFKISNAKSEISLRPTSTSVNKALATIDQRMVYGSLDGFSFGGTNISLEGERILIIKGEDSHDEWSNSAVENDIQRVVSSERGSN